MTHQLSNVYVGDDPRVGQEFLLWGSKNIYFRKLLDLQANIMHLEMFNVCHVVEMNFLKMDQTASFSEINRQTGHLQILTQNTLH